MLTGVEAFEISRGKIIAYLLNIAHPEGGSKAKLFIGRDFRVEALKELADALAEQAMTNWPRSVLIATHRTKHRIVAPLPCPDAPAPTNAAVWMVERSGRSVWFATACPNR